MGYPEDYTFSAAELMEMDWLPEGDGLTWSTEELYEPDFSALHSDKFNASGRPEYMVEFIDAETGALQGTIYLNEFWDPVGGSDINLAETWKEMMSHVGGQTLPGDLFGREAAGHYAECTYNENISSFRRAGCWYGGLFASLWTPETSLTTAGVLASGALAGSAVSRYSIRLDYHDLGRNVVKRNLGRPYQPDKYWHINYTIDGKKRYFILKIGKIVQQLKYKKYLR